LHRSGAAAAPTATDAVAPTNTTCSAENQVNISHIQFSPAMLIVQVGTMVTWKGSQRLAHGDQRRRRADAFDQSISQRATVVATFTTAGTYKYHCSIHASMHGTIVVTVCCAARAQVWDTLFS
jgi:plastocyanin